MNFKNLKKVSTILSIVAFMGLITLNSCNKEQLETKSVNELNSTKPVTEMTDTEVEAKINTFITKAESNEKSNEVLSLEDAIWNIEAALNYKYAKAWIGYSNEKQVSKSYDFNGSINSLFKVYNEVIIDFNKELISISESNKSVMFFDVEEDDNNLLISYLITFENTSKSIATTYFNSTDWWYWANNQGKCNGYTGTGDAASKIRQACNQKYFLNILPPGVYFTDVKYVWQYGAYPINPNDDILNDNYCDRLGFCSYTQYPDHHNCLSPDEMNFYVDGLYQNSLINMQWPEHGGLYHNENIYPNVTFTPMWIYHCYDGPGNNVDVYTWTICTKSGIKHYPMM